MGKHTYYKYCITFFFLTESTILVGAIHKYHYNIHLQATSIYGVSKWSKGKQFQTDLRTRTKPYSVPKISIPNIYIVTYYFLCGTTMP